MIAGIEVDKKLTCYHCGQVCEEKHMVDDKPFCCYGCKTVYEILSANQLCEYYALDKTPGEQLREPDDESYLFLDQGDVRMKLLDFNSDTFCRVTFSAPSIHCVSCIWLLENLHKLNANIARSEVNFAQKKVTIDFNPSRIKLSEIAKLLSSVGYRPRITLDAEESRKPRTDRSLLLKVSVAGFCFGNVMLFSFPEYLGIDHSEKDLIRIFAWLNLALSIPVFFYSGWDYMTSAAKSFRQRQINIDVPIAAGLLALFLRSTYDILTATGPGYLDSFTGLVFFLLIGRWFQSKTYESLAFNRDFTSYFPLAVSRLEQGEWNPVIIYNLDRNDTVRLRNTEIIPADSILLDDVAYIDYSFVTGESRPVKTRKGDLLYAGGRLIGVPVRLKVEKKTSQSQLTGLWNNEAFKKHRESGFQKIIDRTARRFTWIVLFIALATAVYWQATEPAQTWLVLTSVLMVACPCALALAAPFTFGSMVRVFGSNNLYLKNADVVERMAVVDTVVFDKTGTVTHGKDPDVSFHGEMLPQDFSAVKTLTGYSAHPLSKIITSAVRGAGITAVENFKEIPGKGIEGYVCGNFYRVGSPAFTGAVFVTDTEASRVFVAINGTPRGYFSIKTTVRRNLREMLGRLGDRCFALLSGDHAGESKAMRRLFGENVELLFDQGPSDKLTYIRDLQRQGRKVLMVGDGLNDAGALRQADVGIAVSEDSGVFTPASDGILYGSNLHLLDKFLSLSRASTLILKIGFGISFFYNAIALTFAATGHLTPLVAAILMPVSSISVVGFTTGAVHIAAQKTIRKQKNI